MLIDLIYAVILGVIEGITEWLPISSTAHIIIVQELFKGLSIKTSFSEEFILMFDVVIQLGAIFAVIIIYFKKLYPFKFNDNEYSQKDKINIWFKVIIASIPLVIIGLAFDDIITKLFYNLLTISISLIFYGVVFIFLDKQHKNKMFEITDVKSIKSKKALAIGFFQTLALIPGTSRSGITIISSTMLGCDKKSATEFSFFLSIPVMIGASFYKIIKYTLQYTLLFKEIIILIIAMLTALLISLFVVKKLLNFLKKYSFKVFGFYRIALGLIILIMYFL